MFYPCLCVCVFVCAHNYSKSYGGILIKFLREVRYNPGVMHQ